MDKVLYKLLNSFSITGDEENIKNVIKAEIDILNLKHYEDKKGNIIVQLSEENESINKESLMICTHMDSNGFIVSDIENNGILKVIPIGDFGETNLCNSLVKFKNGTKGKLINYNKNSVNNSYYVDIGVNSKYDASKRVKVSNTLSLYSEVIENDDYIFSPALNNSLGCYILLKCLQNLKLLMIGGNINLKENVYFVFTVESLCLSKGAQYVASNLMPDKCIVIATEDYKDKNGQTNDISLLDGAFIKCFDDSLIIHQDIKERLEKSFTLLNMSPKYYVGKSGKDGGVIHKAGSGIKTGELCILLKYKNTNLELVKKSDIKECIDILFKTIL